MRSPLLALAGIVPAALLIGLALAGCGHLNARVVIGRGVVAADGAFDAAVIAADKAIDTGALAPATVKAIHADVDAGNALRKAAETTYAAGGTPDVGAQTRALSALAAEITALLPKGK
jgi:hypothetical protein